MSVVVRGVGERHGKYLHNCSFKMDSQCVDPSFCWTQIYAGDMGWFPSLKLNVSWRDFDTNIQGTDKTYTYGTVYIYITYIYNQIYMYTYTFCWYFDIVWHMDQRSRLTREPRSSTGFPVHHGQSALPQGQFAQAFGSDLLVGLYEADPWERVVDHPRM